MTFSENQVRQLYVATKAVATATAIAESDDPGTIKVKATKNKEEIYFQYKGAIGDLMRSDLIQVHNILYAKATPASDMVGVLKSFKITLDNEVNNGQPVTAQDYILRVGFTQYLGMSDQDTYNKFGEFHAHAGDGPSKLYAKLAISLAMNFSKDMDKNLIKIELDGAEKLEVTDRTRYEDIESKTFTGIIISEVPQPWRLGVIEQVPVFFKLYDATITVDGDERRWAKIEDTTPKKQADGTYVPALTSANSYNNGKKIADLEYFCIGERGDQYRQIGWPNTIDTKYLVDPTKEYNVLDIHYCYVGSNEGPQRSEKDITIVANDKAVLNKIIADINTATGLTIDSLK